MDNNNNNHDHSEDDFVMAFQDTADRLTMLLIHGFPLSSSLWTMQLDDLEGYIRIIAPDLRGHGNSDNVPGPYSVEMLADDCADLLGHLNVPTPFVVCGLSMGGYVALEFYRRYPEHVAALILTATRAAPDTEEGKMNRDRMIETAKKHGVTAVNKAMLPKLFAPDNYENDSELVSFVQDMMDKTSLEGMVGALAAMRDRPDSRPTLGDIDVPVLIIHGEADQIVPLAEAEAMMEAIPDAELVVLEDAGHLPNLEQPDDFNEAVIEFLEILDLE